MKPEPRIVDGVPMCSEFCANFRSNGGMARCLIDSSIFVPLHPCEPAIRNLVAQVAEVKRLCKSHNNPGSNPGAHKLAGDVLRILEDV